MCKTTSVLSRAGVGGTLLGTLAAAGALDWLSVGDLDGA